MVFFLMRFSEFLDALFRIFFLRLKFVFLCLKIERLCLKIDFLCLKIDFQPMASWLTTDCQKNKWYVKKIAYGSL